MKKPRQLPLYLPLQASYSPDDFIQSASNQQACQLIRSWPQWPGKMAAIYGERGCGKTHLAHIWQARAGARFINAYDFKILSPLDATRNFQAFVLDSADEVLGGMAEHEAWMFHFYNLIQEKNAFLLMCCTLPPTRWAIALPDLISRLSTVISIAVNPPDEEALRAVLFKLCSGLGMTLSGEVADYILRRMERSFAGAHTIIEQLDSYTLSTHRQPTVGLVREMLQASPETNTSDH